MTFSRLKKFSLMLLLLWGFWQGAHWRPKAALWRKDWSMKPAGEIFTRLLTEEWHSAGTGKTGSKGELKFRGYYGRYTFQAAGHTFTATFSRQADRPAEPQRATPTQ